LTSWCAALQDFVVGGLHKQTITAITRQITDAGFNCIRLPYSVALFHTNPVVPRCVEGAKEWGFFPQAAM
jgi:hypothetical protein